MYPLAPSQASRRTRNFGSENAVNTTARVGNGNSSKAVGSALSSRVNNAKSTKAAASTSSDGLRPSTPSILAEVKKWKLVNGVVRPPTPFKQPFKQGMRVPSVSSEPATRAAQTISTVVKAGASAGVKAGGDTGKNGIKSEEEGRVTRYNPRRGNTFRRYLSEDRIDINAATSTGRETDRPPTLARSMSGPIVGSGRKSPSPDPAKKGGSTCQTVGGMDKENIPPSDPAWPAANTPINNRGTAVPIPTTEMPSVLATTETATPTNPTEESTTANTEDIEVQPAAGQTCSSATATEEGTTTEEVTTEKVIITEEVEGTQLTADEKQLSSSSEVVETPPAPTIIPTVDSQTGNKTETSSTTLVVDGPTEFEAPSRPTTPTPSASSTPALVKGIANEAAARSPKRALENGDAKDAGSPPKKPRALE
ncbi:hypothetical protein HK097_003751 [Rhizophlyctis rosea]|uniref:Uncharacterized protein n=1 Tax=Rhizophlyctis rosea TaxID=64517 RepID=A0AAD5S4I4_9FUNG|nr:hypothetical protein HK097_003751 [Rhizophlyctis rosea]